MLVTARQLRAALGCRTAVCKHNHLRFIAAALPTDVQEARNEQSSRLRRFYVEAELRAGASYTLDGDESKHLVKVLRAKVGDHLELADGRGNLMDGEVCAISKSRATVQAVGDLQYEPWEGPHVTLAVACGGLKGGRSDWLVEKATELGAKTFTPLVTARASLMGSDGPETFDTAAGGADSAGRLARWSRVASAALKQSLRAHALQITDATDVAGLARHIRSSECLALVGAAGGVNAARAFDCAAPAASSSHVVLVIGPEGDFTEDELLTLVAAGAVLVGLGKRRLRVETAALALLSTVMLQSDGSE